MNELLSNPAVQTAVIVLVTALAGLFVAAVNYATNWLKSKFPTQSALIESNYCYIQPRVESALASVAKARTQGTLSGAVVSNIILTEVSDFISKYYKLEGKDATNAEIAAARADITTALARETGI